MVDGPLDRSAASNSSGFDGTLETRRYSVLVIAGLNYAGWLDVHVSVEKLVNVVETENSWGSGRRLGRFATPGEGSKKGADPDSRCT